ncbi:pyridoxal phosphate-dependent transferase [Aspergillus novoparasiticus]|uniref:Pyridoxal phosphate-dependent transferase n=1 Tax=Aspergillus novoparasiticus TaxID=986946 RepID=A0A5N6EKI4_9EURO|nr:pyridoxal phosphate-dependent transferase [Aspergillus novoparasiticus]
MTTPSPASRLLDDLIQQYVAANPRSRAANERACKVMPAGNTRAVFVYQPFPIVMATGRDCYLSSLDGVEYIDFVSEYFAGMYGHSHPAIQSAIQETCASGFNFGAPSQIEIELAEEITSRFPSMDMLQFCTSGTEANTLAIAVGLNFSQRKKVLAFENGYHGNTLSFKGSSGLRLPHEFILAPYNDINGTGKLLTTDVGVIIVEPMQGAGGMVPATKEFLSFLRQQATRLGAVLIFDEVVTARTHYNGLQSYHNIIPDMTTIGKFYGGGLPFGAYGGRQQIMNTLDSRAANGLHHSGTWHNNKFTIAAGLAAMKLLSRENIEKANTLGERLRDGLDKVFNVPGPTTAIVRGFGSLVGLHFLGPDSDNLRDAFYFFLLTHKIYVGHRGFLCLNIMHEEKHVVAVLEASKAFYEVAFMKSN